MSQTVTATHAPDQDRITFFEGNATGCIVVADMSPAHPTTAVGFIDRAGARRLGRALLAWADGVNQE